MKTFLTSIFYQPLYNLLFWFVLILPGENLGLGIIALTVLIRLILLPLSAQGVRAQRELQVLQPEIDKLRVEYKDQPEELNKKIFALYQEHKVNPLGSCLPLLIQLPVLILLYNVIISGIKANHLDLLYRFVPAPEHLNTIFLGINLNDPSIPLAIISGLLQFVQTWQLMRRQTPAKTTQLTDPQAPKPVKDSSQQMSQTMAYLMPLLTVYIGTKFPAGLAIYWVVTTLFSIAQQWWLFRTKPSLVSPHVSVQIRDHK
jgi:YidC/Oxa1 family membrane protein insertase